MEQNKRLILLVICDTAAAILAILAAISVKFMKIPGAEEIYTTGVAKIAVFTITVVFLSFLVEIYKNQHELISRDIAVKIGASLGVSCFVF